MLNERKNFYAQEDKNFADFSYIFGNNDPSSVYSTIFMSILEELAIFKDNIEFSQNIFKLFEGLDYYDTEQSNQGSIENYIKPILTQISGQENLTHSIYYAHWYLNQIEIYSYFGRALKTILYREFYSDGFLYQQVFTNSLDYFENILEKIASLFKICINYYNESGQDFKTIGKFDCPLIFLKKYSNNSHWIMYHKDMIAFMTTPNPSMLSRYPFISQLVNRPLPPRVPSNPIEFTPIVETHVRVQKPEKILSENDCIKEIKIRPKLNLSESNPRKIFSNIKNKYEISYSSSQNVPIDKSKKTRPELKLVPVMKKQSNPKPSNFQTEPAPNFPFLNQSQYIYNTNNFINQKLQSPPQSNNVTPPTVLVRQAAPTSGQQPTKAPNPLATPTPGQELINSPPQSLAPISGSQLMRSPPQSIIPIALSGGQAFMPPPSNFPQATMNSPFLPTMMINLPPNQAPSSSGQNNHPGYTVNYNTGFAFPPKLNNP